MRTPYEILIELFPDLQYDSDKITVLQAKRAMKAYATQALEEQKAVYEAIEEENKRLANDCEVLNCIITRRAQKNKIG